MNVSAPFIERPVATTLLTLGIAIAGGIAYSFLPVAPLPQVDFPTITVQASLPGASPETMAATVATPLERSLGEIAGVTEITSSSSLSSTRVVLQFDLKRDIDGAARDVQAAINAARTLLPTGMPSNPTYRKVNPADAPIMIIALTSDTMTRGQMYDAASTILAQKLSQVSGIGTVNVGGSSLPAVRVELNPSALQKYAINPENVRAAITATNANRPKGSIELGDRNWQIYANDQAAKAVDYMPIIVAYHNGAPVRLADVSDVVDSVQDLRNAGSANGKNSVLLVLFRQPGANIIETVDRVTALLPYLRASIPSAINLDVVLDRSPTIRASLFEVERTLFISVCLVIMVVFVFLRNWRATLIPSVAVPVSLIGTFTVMYLCHYSLDMLSLMALTIATGFVVDDAVVVLENVSRHLEEGMRPMQAALTGAREVGFTVLSMSLSLIAVFIPILLMGGIVGRLFREFAVVLSVAILVSLVVSLSTTPMMCSRLLRSEKGRKHGRWYLASERVFEKALHRYESSLVWALRHGPFMMLLLAITIGLNVLLYIIIPKGFFPQQDVGRLNGNIQADQSISFQAMQTKLNDFVRLVREDPDVVNVIAFTGGGGFGGGRNTGSMFVTLKPLGVRKSNADEVIARIRKATINEPGAALFLVPVQDIRVGGRASNAQWQYTLQSDDLTTLRAWEPKIRQALTEVPELTDVNTDAQDKGLQTSVFIDRPTASRLGVTPAAIDNTLNDFFGQREVSTIYNPLNQYWVVMEAAPQYWQSPTWLSNIYVAAANAPTVTTTANGVQINPAVLAAAQAPAVNGAPKTGSTAPPPAANGSPMVPMSAFATYGPTNTPLAVNHQGQFAASTISFNLPVGVSLSEATKAVDATMFRIGVPSSVRGSFQGTAKTFQDSLNSQPILILTALITIYIVLGVLYESYVHPITILSTLPSAGVGALLALLLFRTDFSIIALIGVILLIGIVKKNAIMMVDFAIDAERRHNLAPEEAIRQACSLRFRPIMMTTAAALFGAIPLAIGFGDGSEFRRPLGISIVGGLIVSQMLTLYTTPVVYLYIDRFGAWARERREGSRARRERGVATPAAPDIALDHK
jgi:multidrug efflux pump